MPVVKSANQSFRGADLTAVLGRCEVDLAGAAIGGGEAIIDLFAWCGAIEIRVPSTWTVTNEVRPILGAVVDKRESGQAGAKQQLVVRGMAIMGGVEIRH